jgi:DNA mismatch endonuclease, patch repair protein
MGATRGSARPLPSSPAVRDQMSRLGQRDTTPELALRSELHRRGLRFRVDRRPVAGVRTRADLLFAGAKVAVYVDGCFWHGCPEHATYPAANGDWWAAKLAMNQQRDRKTTTHLEGAGWTVIRVWEHEAAEHAASRIEDLLRGKLSAGAPTVHPNSRSIASPNRE